VGRRVMPATARDAPQQGFSFPCTQRLGSALAGSDDKSHKWGPTDGASSFPAMNFAYIIASPPARSWSIQVKNDSSRKTAAGISPLSLTILRNGCLKLNKMLAIGFIAQRRRTGFPPSTSLHVCGLSQWYVESRVSPRTRFCPLFGSISLVPKAEHPDKLGGRPACGP
jgi:hypothetical protein